MQEKREVISDLRVISLLQPGQTLSPKLMSILDHKAWFTTIWRTAQNENRDTTVDHIHKILREALYILEYDPYIDQNLITNIKLALNGIKSLRDTYFDTCYVIFDINKIISYTTINLELIIAKKRELHQNND